MIIICITGTSATQILQRQIVQHTNLETKRDSNKISEIEKNRYRLKKMTRKTSTSKAAAADAKRSVAATKQAVLKALSKCLHEVAKKNNGKLPYGHMQSYVKENRRLYDWVTRDALNSAYTRYKKDLLGKVPVSQVEISIGSKLSGTISTLSQS